MKARPQKSGSLCPNARGISLTLYPLDPTFIQTLHLFGAQHFKIENEKIRFR